MQTERDGLPRVIAVVGPTASGKSDLAVALAEALGGEVVNADSMQLYQGMDIGTAKPTPSAVPDVLWICALMPITRPRATPPPAITTAFMPTIAPERTWQPWSTAPWPM